MAECIISTCEGPGESKIVTTSSEEALFEDGSFDIFGGIVLRCGEETGAEEVVDWTVIMTLGGCDCC